MRRKELAVDEENAGERQGTVQVAGVFVADPFPTAGPAGRASSITSGYGLSSLPTPTGLFFADDLQELGTGLKTGHGDSGIEIPAACRIPFQDHVYAFRDIVGQRVPVHGVAINMDFRSRIDWNFVEDGSSGQWFCHDSASVFVSEVTYIRMPFRQGWITPASTVWEAGGAAGRCGVRLPG